MARARMGVDAGGAVCFAAVGKACLPTHGGVCAAHVPGRLSPASVVSVVLSDCDVSCCSCAGHGLYEAVGFSVY